MSHPVKTITFLSFLPLVQNEEKPEERGADGTEGPSIATPNPLALTTGQKQRQQINPSTYSHLEQRSEPHRYTEKLLILR